ncbi:MAG: histidine kinase [Ramlibacter sp.]
MFKLLRYYSAASLVAVLATAVLLTWFYRQVAVAGIVHLAERNNLNLAQVAMNPIKPALLQFLDAAAELGPGSASPPLPPELARSISNMMREDSFISRIKIYNRQGVVVFSSAPAQVGDDQSQNEGFITAMRGGIGSELVYRDTFSFDGVTEEDNLMQTYLPVRAGPAEPIRGVFELYADVNNLMHQAERTQMIVAAGAILILLALYATLVAIVHHANNIIEQQQRTIRERNETLAALSAHMLKAEELHKQKIAFELHEGVAQTLAALKLKAESGRYDRKFDNAPDGAVDSMIPALQDAIQEVRSIATDLRPAILDDMGLLPTIYWLCREFEKRHPDIRVEQRISLDEHDIPLPLKGILYRIIMSVLGDAAQLQTQGVVQLALRIKKNVLILLIEYFANERTARMDAPSRQIQHLRSARMEELATLSGGAFTATRLTDGRTTLRAAWERS